MFSRIAKIKSPQRNEFKNQCIILGQDALLYTRVVWSGLGFTSFYFLWHHIFHFFPAFPSYLNCKW